MASKLDVTYQVNRAVAKLDDQGDTTAPSGVLELEQDGARLADYAGSMAIQNQFRENILYLDSVTAPVNYLTISNSVAGSPVEITSSGSDFNVGIVLDPKGSGSVYVRGVADLSSLDTEAPFVISANAPMVSNLDADKLDGYHASDLLNASNFTGVLTIPQGGTNNSVFAADDIIVANGTADALVSSGYKVSDFSLITHTHDGVYSPVGHNHDGVYEQIDITILRQADVINNLASTSLVYPLSANMGRVLQETKSDINHNHDADYADINHNHDGVYEAIDATLLRQSDVIDNLTSTSVIYPLSANQGRILDTLKAPKDNPVFTGVVTADNITASTGSDLTLYASSGNSVRVFNDSSAGLIVNSSGNAEFTNDLVVQGNLLVQGDTTTINTTNLDIEDQFIEINKGTIIVDQDAGIHVKRTATDASIIWDSSNSYWSAGLVGSEVKIILETDIVDNLTTQSSTRPLSANMGWYLDQNKSDINHNHDTDYADINHNHDGVYEPVDGTILRQSDVVDSLTSTSTVYPLSANMGNLLNQSKADKVIGAVDGNLSSLDSTGNLVDSGVDPDSLARRSELALNGSHLLFVDKNRVDTYVADGSLIKPYKTIQEAYNNAPDYSSIIIAPGHYTENVVVSLGKLDVTFSGTSTVKGDGTRIQGRFHINNTLDKCHIKDIIILSPNNGLPALDIEESASCSFENISIRHSVPGGASPVLSVKGSTAETITFNQCFIAKDGAGTLINGSLGRKVLFFDCPTGSNLELSSTNSSDVIIKNCYDFGSLIHHKGSLIVDNSTVASIDSDASLVTDSLIVVRSSLRSSDHITLGSINKTGASPYLIGDNDSNPDEVYSGTDLGYVRHAKETYYTNLNWVGVSNVKEALDSLKNDLDNIKFTETYYVDPVDGSDVDGDGSLNRPLATVQVAIDYSATSNKVIYLVRGSHVGSISIPDKTYIRIEGEGKNYSSSLVGDDGAVAVTLSGTTSHITFNNLHIQGFNERALNFVDVDGSILFDNCRISRLGTAGDLITFGGSPENNFYFKNTDIEGHMVLSGTLFSSVEVVVEGNSSSLSKFTVNNGNYTLKVLDCDVVGKIVQTTGNVILRDIREIVPDAGVSLQSTAGALNFLHIHKVNFQSPAGSYGSISKTGAAPWIIENTNTNTPRALLTGSRANYAEWAIDIDAGFTPSYYVPSSASVTSHLQSIDNILSFDSVGTSDAIPDTIVRRDLQASFSANEITANVLEAPVGSSITLVDNSGNGITVVDGGNVEMSHDLKVTGNLIIEGDTTTVNTTNLNIEDQFIEINKSDVIVDQDSGFYVKRTTTDASLMWDSSNSYWSAGLVGSEAKILLETDVVNDLVTISTTRPLSALQGKLLQDNKANKVIGATLDNFASLTASGDLKDSGYTFSDFELVDPSILRTSDVIDNLTSTSVIYPLSANQGRILNELKAPKDNPVFTGIVTADTITSFTGSPLVLYPASGQNLELGTLSGEGLTIDSLGDANFSKNLVVEGDLRVNGTTTSINTVQLEVEDPIIELNRSDAIVDQDGGIHVKRTTVDASLIWDSSNSYWSAGLAGSESRILLESDVVNSLSSPSTVNPLSAYMGSQLNSLKADKVLNAVAGNFASLDISGNILDSGIAPSDVFLDTDAGLNGSKTVYVDKHRSNSYTPDGSYLKPFKTIADAINNMGANETIIVSSGTYVENLVLPGAISGLTIRGTGGTFHGSNTIIQGYVQLSDASNIRFEDLTIEYGIDDANPTLLITGNVSSGMHRFHDVSIKRAHSVASSAVAVKVEGNLQGQLIFNNDNIVGIFDNSSVSASNHPVIIEGLVSPEMLLHNNTPNAITHVNGCQQIGYVTHVDGSVILSNVGLIQPDGSGNCIVSTANASTSTSLLLYEVSLLQQDLVTYGKINKTGDCVWIIKDVNRKSSIDVLTGTRLSYAAFAEDHSYSKVGWAGIENIKQALDHLYDNKSDITHTHTDLTNATNLNVPNTIVKRDANGSFESQDITVSQLKAFTNSSISVQDDAGEGLYVFNGGDAQFTKNLTVVGDLIVEGSSTVINTSTLTVEDHFIELGTVASPTDITANGGGISVKGDTDKTIKWLSSTGCWTFSECVNLVSGKEYGIGGTSVLSSTTLGSGVVNSSLATVSTDLQLGSGARLVNNADTLEVMNSNGTTFTTVKASSFESTTLVNPPLVVASNLLVSNLNADLLDGQEGSYYTDSLNINYSKVGWVGITNVSSALDSLKDDLESIGTSVNSGTPLATPDTIARRDGNASFAVNSLEANTVLSSTGDSIILGDSSSNGLTINDGGSASFSHQVTAPSFVSTVSTGTSPLVVGSSTVVTNLNADLLDGLHASAFELVDTTILRQADVVDNLSSTSTIYPLSANQGKLLNDSLGLNGSSLLFVDKARNVGFTADGSYNRPFNTIGDALAVATGDQTIILAPGVYTEDVALATSGVSIYGMGGDSPVIRGKFVINGASNILVQDVTLESLGVNGVDYALHIIGSNVHDIEVRGCKLLRSNNPSVEPAVRVDSINSGNVIFKDCYIQGDFDNSAGSAIYSSIVLEGCYGPLFRVIANSLTTRLLVNNSAVIQKITHQQGQVYISNVTSILEDLLSTAPANINNFLGLREVSLMSSGSYSIINKTGDCSYSFMDVDRDTALDIINASSVKVYGRQTVDIMGYYSPANYTANSTDSLYDHLNGIDLALGLTTAATSSNIPNTIVKRDSNGSFGATVITLDQINSTSGTSLLVTESSGLGMTIEDTTGKAIFTGELEGGLFTSTVADGQAPFSLLSTTLVSNLNADMLDGEHGAYYLDPQNSGYTKVGWAGVTNVYEALNNLKDAQDILGNNAVLRDGSTPLTANWDAGAYSISASSFKARSGASVKLVDFSGQGLTINNGGDAVFSQNVTIAGDLVVDGGNTTISSATLVVEDQNIVLGRVASPTDATANGGGITLEGTTDKQLYWMNDSNENWTSSENFNLELGRVYRINNVDVLSSTTLGNSVTISNLQSVGVLSSGTWEADVIEMAFGGTGKALTPSEGGIVYSGATNLEILSPVAEANKVLMSGPSTVPHWSSYSLPVSVFQGDMVYSSADNSLTTLSKSVTSNQVLMNSGVNNNPQWSTLDSSMVTINSAVHQSTTVEEALDDSVLYTEIVSYVASSGYLSLTYLPVERTSLHVEVVSGASQINWDTPGRGIQGVNANYWIGNSNGKRVYFDKSLISDGDTDPGVTLTTPPADGTKYLVVYSAVRNS